MKSYLGAQIIRALQRKVSGRGRTLRERYPEYKIGAGSYGDLTVLDWGEGATLSIGAYTSIGTAVWIANEAVIMSGVTVGDGAVIGARAVVTRDVPAYAIVAGNPARIARFRFDQTTIERLLRIKWWDWEPRRIAKSMSAMLSADIESFMLAAESGEL
jgi:chloramphenicol O-acetyltransferase type B